MSTSDLSAAPQENDSTPVVHESTPGPQSLATRRVSDSSEILQLLRFFYNHNPFYPISAVFILLGLHHLFYDAESAQNITAINFNSAVLMAVMAGYAVILATIVCLIVRLGSVWDDSRTILITIVLLLVTLSIIGDKPILMHAGAAPGFLIGGLCFSIGLCEIVLRITRIKMPWQLRDPFYAFLALFFLYPVGLDYCLNVIGETQNLLARKLTLLGVLLFPTVAGVVGLSLLPAVWKGPALTADNRTPWKWPLYPWSLFLMLAVAVVLRAYYLTVSFHPRMGMDSAFRFYFLTPFLLAVAIILFEMAKSVGRHGIEQLLMLGVTLFIPLSMSGIDRFPYAADFLNLHRHYFGSPVQVACGCVIIFWAYAAMRGGPSWAREALPFAIAFLAFTSKDTLNAQTFEKPSWMPLAAACVVMGITTLFSPRSSFRWMATVIFGVAAATIHLWGTTFTLHRGAIPINILLIAAILCSVIFDDHFARFLRRWVAMAMFCLACGVVAYSAKSQFAPSPSTTLIYVTVLTSIAWVIWWRLHNPDSMTSAVLVTLAAGTQAGLMIAAEIQKSSNPQGTALLVLGIFCLAVAASISATKVHHARSDQQLISA